MKKFTLWLVPVVLGSFACGTVKKESSQPAPTPAPVQAAAEKPKATTSPQVAVAEKKSESPTRLDVRCTSGSDQRGIVVLPKDAGCELHYSKFGTSSVIANAQNSGTEYCDQVQDKVRKNLEAAGFSCQ